MSAACLRLHREPEREREALRASVVRHLRDDKPSPRRANAQRVRHGATDTRRPPTPRDVARVDRGSGGGAAELAFAVAELDAVLRIRVVVLAASGRCAVEQKDGGGAAHDFGKGALSYLGGFEPVLCRSNITRRGGRHTARVRAQPRSKCSS